MKLKNPLIIDDLRKFYFQNNWSHSEVQEYLRNHYKTKVCIRTLKRWKKCLANSSWQGPNLPNPPTPNKALNEVNIKRVIDFRKKTGWGALTSNTHLSLSARRAQ